MKHFPPCGPTAAQLMAHASRCPVCGSRDLTPVSNCRRPPIFAIACDDCIAIEGDAPTLAEAIVNWNRIKRQGRRNTAPSS